MPAKLKKVVTFPTVAENDAQNSNPINYVYVPPELFQLRQ